MVNNSLWKVNKCCWFEGHHLPYVHSLHFDSIREIDIVDHQIGVLVGSIKVLMRRL